MFNDKRNSLWYSKWNKQIIRYIYTKGSEIMKGCSTLLLIREMQVLMIMGQNLKAWQYDEAVEKQGLCYIAGGNVN